MKINIRSILDPRPIKSNRFEFRSKISNLRGPVLEIGPPKINEFESRS